MNPVDRAIMAIEEARSAWGDYRRSFEVLDHIDSALQALRDKEFVCVPDVIKRALKSYRDEHCFDDSEYGIAIDKFLAAQPKE